MRKRCPPSCTNSSLFVYISAIGLFTICNFIALILIQQHMKGKNETPKNIIEKHIRDENHPENLQLNDFSGRGGFLIGDLIENLPFHFNRTSFRSDVKRAYFIHDSVVIGNAWDTASSLGRVTLATQTSIDKLYLLMDVAEAWKGPMSVAIFVPAVDFYIAKIYIAYLRICSKIIRYNATFHFLYHRDMSPQFTVPYNKHTVPSCTRSIDTLPLLMRYRTSSFRRWWQQALYPQNHLRNVAVLGCVTPYHFMTDIDIIPVPGLAKHLNTFLNHQQAQTCNDCLYVVPTYEMPEKLPVPRSKKELIERVRRKQGRPFHAKVFIYNQFATNHSLWEATPDLGYLVAAYKITNYEFFYEPFYVAESHAPLHDERFIGYGFTRNTQVFEMYLAGFEFWVLNPAFAVHKGMQNKRGRGAWRERQNIINRKQFLRFKNEMALKYKNFSKRSKDANLRNHGSAHRNVSNTTN